MENITNQVENLPRFVLEEYDKQIMQMLVENGYEEIQVDDLDALKKLHTKMRKNRDIMKTKLVAMPEKKCWLLYCELFRHKKMIARTQGIKCIPSK